MTNQRSKLRRNVRLICFLIAALLLLPLPFWINSSRILVQASPFITICTILAGETLWFGSILGIGIFVISLVRKRFFCRYICPVGLLLDTVSDIKLPAKTWWKGCPSLGRFIVLITIAGSVIGYPLFLWMDPLAILNNAFSVYKASDLLSAIISLAGIVILLLLALTSGSLWCARICPLGSTQDLLEDTGSFFRNFREIKKSRFLRRKRHPETLFQQPGECLSQLLQVWD